METVAIQQGADEAARFLPPLRQDLAIVPSAPGEDGAPTWLLYDPLKNQYFRLGKLAFAMLSNWQSGAPLSSWLPGMQQREPEIDQAAFEQFHRFILAKDLCRSSSPKDRQRLEAQHKNQQQTGLKWLLIHYLFIRIPLLRPDRFLTATFSCVNFFFQPWFRRCMVLTGCVGLLLVIRQWDLFTATMLQFFNLRGAVFFALTLFVVKAFHELGHAYTAKRYGCRVPTMGLALLVLYPFLYTDTTDAWKLTSRRQRLAIVLAGVKTELALACIGTFLWSFLDTGILKSIAFFIATTSLLASLSINLSPFMRFDGYYALSDWLGAENLQQRAFALCRWRLRELLFGFNHPPPEALPGNRQKIFLLYGYATWIYRFFLFLGIALLVYHMTFKLLGILLFAVEIIYFIGAPVMREMHSWWCLRTSVRINRNILLFGTLLIFTLFAGLYPWRTQISVPAVLEAKHTVDLFAPEDAQLYAAHVEVGEQVHKGELLFTLHIPELATQRNILRGKAHYLETRIKRHIGSRSDLDQIDVLQRELARVNTDIAGIERRIARGEVRSPQDGYISAIIESHPGQWVSRRHPLAQVVNPQQTEIRAYVDENRVRWIRQGASATFYGNSGDETVRGAEVISVSEAAVAALDHPELASLYGGPIPVRQLEQQTLRPENGVYQIVLSGDPVTSEGFSRRVAGRINIETEPVSPFAHFIRYAASVFIRESGM